jgi:hypothetical protein
MHVRCEFLKRCYLVLRNVRPFLFRETVDKNGFVFKSAMLLFEWDVQI